MNQKNRLFGILLTLIAFCTTSKAQTDGWIELINGKDFTGWKASENMGTWTVVDGMFQNVGKRSHLWYEGEHLKDGFKNFEIEVQVKTFKLANSGIYFHTEYQETNWPNKGFEIQVNNSHIGEGDYIELKRMASLYGTRNLYKSFGKDEKWMTIRARVESNRVQIWCDGMKTVDYIQPEVTAKGVKRLSKGTFCLQGHDVMSKSQYRSFKVRRLPDDAKSTIVAPQFGAWYDSLRAMQGRQFGFIDLNPKTKMTAAELTNYVYATGINASLVKTPATVSEFSSGKNLPLFFGVKVTSSSVGNIKDSKADYIVGESTDLASAKALLKSGKINVWSDKGKVLNAQNADELLGLANQNSVAIEIDNVNQTPSVEVLKIAKAKGLKFTFSGLIPVSNIEKSQYAFEAAKAANLNYKDLYIPNW